LSSEMTALAQARGFTSPASCTDRPGNGRATCSMGPACQTIITEIVIDTMKSGQKVDRNRHSQSWL
jgi:hypothetical protein